MLLLYMIRSCFLRWDSLDSKAEENVFLGTVQWDKDYFDPFDPLGIVVVRKAPKRAFHLF